MTVEPSAADTPGPGNGEPVTGDDRVDSAIGGLGELDAVPVQEHAERYTNVHSQLQDILNAVGSTVVPVDRPR